MKQADVSKIFNKWAIGTSGGAYMVGLETAR